MNGGALLGINDLTIKGRQHPQQRDEVTSGLLSMRSNTLVDSGAIVGGCAAGLLAVVVESPNVGAHRRD